jgi:hypothetical protein
MPRSQYPGSPSAFGSAPATGWRTRGGGRALEPQVDGAEGTDELEFLAALDAAPDRPALLGGELGAAYSGTGWRDDLTRRLRVVLHAAPLLTLRAADAVQSPDRRHYDSLVLALRVFDVVLASMGLDRGVDKDVVARVLAPLLTIMDEAIELPIDAARHQAVTARVLGALLNDGAGREVFQASYTDIPVTGPATAVRLPFRLLEEYDLPDGGLALRMTSEAINLFLGALDRDIEDEQVAMEALIREQLERGSFAKAVQSAESAQLQSRRYTMYIDTKLRLTRRDLKLVNWRAEMTPMLEQAHTHVQRRINAERAIIDVASEQGDLLVPGTREAGQVATVIRLVTQCCTRHAQLSQTLVGARAVFLEEQGRQGFAVAMEGQRPDFVRDILEPVLREPSARAVRVTDATLQAIAAPRAPALLDLNALIAWCLKPRREVATGEIPVAEQQIVTVPEPLLRFPVEIRTAAEAALRSIEAPCFLSAVLADGEQRGWAPALLDCVTLMASLEHGRDPEHHRLIDVVRAARRFAVAGISGDELVLLPAATLVSPSTPTMSPR